MKDKVCFKSDTSAQIIILTGFVIAVIIVGMGTVLYSVANSGQQTSILQSDRAYNNFENIREEYGIALMVSSEYGEINPFNVSNTTIILEFEDRMKTIVESHGFILNFTGYEYIENKNRAIVNILFTDGKKVFNDTVTYNLLTGKILYDTIPPGYIDDLHAEPYEGQCILDGAVILNWTAVGNDYYEDTSAYKYEIRYSNKSITQENFDNATPYRYFYNVEKNGTQQEYYVEELDRFVDWYFAIKVYDKAGNFNFSNSPHAEAYEWAPEIDNITGNSTGNLVPISESEPELQVNKSNNVTIEFNVTDRDEDNVSIRFMIKNSTSNWIEDDYWTDISPVEYNNVTFNYTFYNIQENWDFYINVTDDSGCERSRTSPEGAPDYNYAINLTDYTPPKTIAINSIDNVSDAYIDEDDPLNPHDGDEILIDGKNIKRGLIWFNLTGIPTNAVIESAEISLYTFDRKNANVISIYKVNDSWNETTVNWSSITGYEPIETDSSIPILNDYSNWSVTEDVEDYLIDTNNGWIIRYSDDETNTATQYAKFYSKTGTNGPILYVTYTE